MNENVIEEFKILIQMPIAKQAVDSIIESALSGIDSLYSYIVRCKIDDASTSVIVKYTVSEHSKYNTIPSESLLDVVHGICGKNYDCNKIIAYAQPPIEIILTLYEPMFDKMVHKMNRQWPTLEAEDLGQICRMCCVELYNKGYYVHKGLLWTAFKNAVIEDLRPLKKRGNVISLYEKNNSEMADDRALTIADTIADTDALYNEIDQQTLDAELAIFEEVKDIIIDLVGQRQFDALYRDYKNKHTTTSTRKLLIKIKSHLKNLGITRSDFNNKYH